MQDSRWTMLAVLFFARVAFGIQFQSVASVSHHLFKPLGIDYTEIGFLVGLYLLPGVVIALPGGQLGDRFGDKRVAVVGLALMAIGGLLIGASDTITVMMTGRLLSGIGAVFLSVLMTKMVADWFVGREIATAMAIFINGFPIGIGIGLVTLPVVAEVLTWSAVFYVTAAVSFLALILFAATYKAPAELKGQSGPGPKPMLSGQELGLVCLAGAMWALYNGAYVIMLSFAPSFLVTTGMSASTAGAVVSINTWIIVASVAFGGVLVDHFGRPNLFMVVGCLGCAGCILLVPFWSATYLLFIVMGLFGGAAASPMFALPAEVLRQQNRAVGIGVFYTWFYGGTAVLPALAGFAGDRLGSADVPLIVAGALVIAVLLPLALFRTIQRGTSTPIGP